jgi:hypothetical protein
MPRRPWLLVASGLLAAFWWWQVLAAAVMTTGMLVHRQRLHRPHRLHLYGLTVI